jgi:regulatory protein
MTVNKQSGQSRENEITKKVEKYCAYTERCRYDVEQKLIRLGADTNSIPEIIQHLTAAQYIDNERFAALFARGKHHNNKWGKVKIRAELQKRKINETDISKALEGIEDQEYHQCLHSLIQKKTEELRNKNLTQQKARVAAYCIQKGFETHLVLETIDNSDAR